MNIGTVACAIPATLESMCFSPQATSQNGSAALITPSTRQGNHAARSWASALRPPSRQARYPSSTTPAPKPRTAISTDGSTSSTATLMKRYEAPQTAARTKISGP